MPFLFLLIVCVPIIEITLIIQLGSWLGIGWTLALIIFTAVVGAALVKQQGVAVIARAQHQWQQGQVPAKTMVEGLALALAGLMLLTPGFMTDAIGLALLFPPWRQKIAQTLMERIVVRSAHQGDGFSRHSSQGNTYDGEYQRTAESSSDETSSEQKKLP
ncbi:MULTISPECIES: FxsA family protein [unclassified Vibrio]|uniref:FxsA family protein n=1 Tax=Vibrio sp. HB236076 TaxID=3232307 RepID=A0AB39HF34_9VIBR|nr:FxsA family protein [Vibrio sp. HB161653]MDP5255443.1 FxsA family protein [Vibrio sp. HB161653]